MYDPYKWEGLKQRSEFKEDNEDEEGGDEANELGLPPSRALDGRPREGAGSCEGTEETANNVH